MFECVHRMSQQCYILSGMKNRQIANISKTGTWGNDIREKQMQRK